MPLYYIPSTLDGLILVPTYYVGQILKIGPTSTEITSDFKKISEWRGTVECFVPPGKRPVAREDSSRFLEKIEELGQNEFASISSYETGPYWQPDRSKTAHDITLPIRFAIERGETDSPSNAERNLFLLLASSSSSEDEYPCAAMGFVPHNAQEGDMSCLSVWCKELTAR